MKYQEFEAAFMRENRILKVGLALSMVLLLTLTFLTRMQKAYFIYQGGEIFKENLLLVDICKEGFESILKKKAHSFFVTDGIRSILKREPFDISEHEFLSVRELDQNHCKAILKTSEGLRSFVLELQKQKEFEFDFKISSIKETEISREDQ